MSRRKEKYRACTYSRRSSSVMLYTLLVTPRVSTAISVHSSKVPTASLLFDITVIIRLLLSSYLFYTL